jgi:hypothetical protein
MLTSVVRFNHNSARANQLQPDSARPPLTPYSTHPLPRVSSPRPRAASLKNPRRLIANPRLEFQVSLIRISELKFPNRKFSAIPPRTRALLQSPASSLQNLIETRGLESAITPINPVTSNFLIETKRGFLRPPWRNTAFSSQFQARCFPASVPQGFATYRLENCSLRLFIFGISQIWM